jgi:hypothetical protein
MEMNLPFERVVIVSKVNIHLIESLINSNGDTNCKFEVASDLKKIHRLDTAHSAIIATSARSHYLIAKELLNNGINLLIEKPIVLKVEEARALIELANLSGSNIFPGLQYRFCSYLYNFKNYINSVTEKMVYFSLSWSDGFGETRYGETKTYDYSLNIAQDIMPHIWSILSTIFQSTKFRIQSCSIKDGGRIAVFEINGPQIKGQINLERDAHTRKRALEINFPSGRHISIDFTSEPGLIKDSTGHEMSGDFTWAEKPRPIERQLDIFFDLKHKNNQATDSNYLLNSVIFCQEASDKIKALQSKALKNALNDDRSSIKVHHLELRESIAEFALKRGLLQSIDNDSLEEFIKRMIGDISANNLKNELYMDLLNDAGLM